MEKLRLPKILDLTESEIKDILLHPGIYVGSIEKHTQKLWVYENGEMVYRSISYVPGFYRIFDGLLISAARNKKRDPSMDSLKVTIDAEANTVSVYNNGYGRFPVQIHPEKKVYLPHFFFGPTSTNIFSTEFVVEIADGRSLKKYKQVYSNNYLGKMEDPEIADCEANENWTKVTFTPDLKKFKMACLDKDVVALMKKRVVDMAACLGKGVKVELNETLLPIESFEDYVDLYLKSAEKSSPVVPLPRIHAKVGDRWEICVSLSDGQFQQVSFVNFYATIDGGTHVDYITNQIATYLMNKGNKKKKDANMNKGNKKKKDANVKAHNLKNHLWVFVNARIDNPKFDSLTKETLTTRQARFGSKCDLSKSMLKKVANSGILKVILKRNLLMLKNQLKYLVQVAIGGLNVRKLKKADLVMELEKQGFDPIPQVPGSKTGYEYLLSLPMIVGCDLHKLVGELLIEKEKMENEMGTLTDFGDEVSVSEEHEDSDDNVDEFSDSDADVDEFSDSDDDVDEFSDSDDDVDEFSDSEEHED